MEKNTNITIELPKQLKEEVEFMLDKMGMSIDTAIRMYFSMIVLKNGIPFKLELDPFYGESNTQKLKEAIEGFERTRDEIKKMD